MPSNISAHEYPLSKIFDDDFRYSVPNYQRPYAWEWEHARELFEDIRDAARGANSVDGDDDYFLGCIVVVKSDGKPESQLVDGQQRLTTLTMLLCALRDAVTLEDPKQADPINGYVWQKGDWTKGTKDIVRLELRQQDNRFFQDHVLEPGALTVESARESVRQHESAHHNTRTDTEQLIRGNALKLYDAVVALDAKEREELITYLVTRCFLVVVATSNRSAANRVFGVLNTRGLDLSPTDILKATIAQDASADHIRLWEDLEDNLGRGGFRSLFAHIYTVRTKTRNRKPLEDVFVPDVLGQDFDSNRFVSEVLAPYASAFDNLVSQDSEELPRATRHLQSLRMVDNQDWVPAALRMVEKHGDSPAYVASFLRDLERLAYSMFITRTWRDPRVNRYIEILKLIDAKGDLFASSSPLQLSDDEKLSTLNTLSAQVNMKWAKAVLLRIDGMYYEQSVIKFNRKIITVEHVLPQNPHDNSLWLTWFPESQQRDQWTWKLANLVLLSRSKNSAAGNLDFDEKKRTYFSSGSNEPFPLLQPVMDEEEWTPEVLQRRQDQLINMLADEWRLR